jgi:hypothetical protein
MAALLNSNDPMPLDEKAKKKKEMELDSRSN